MKGCIIWHSKHVSSYEARATKLICHIPWEKWTTRWLELPHSVYVLRGSLTCYTDQAPGTITAFQRVFAVVWLFPTRLPTCQPIVEAFGRSLQLWWKSRKVFAAVSVVRIIRHIDQSTRHLVRDSASDCKYRRLKAFRVLFLRLLMSVFLFFVPWKGAALLLVCTIAIVLEC